MTEAELYLRCCTLVSGDRLVDRPTSYPLNRLPGPLAPDGTMGNGHSIYPAVLDCASRILRSRGLDFFEDAEGFGVVETHPKPRHERICITHR